MQRLNEPTIRSLQTTRSPRIAAIEYQRAGDPRRRQPARRGNACGRKACAGVLVSLRSARWTAAPRALATRRNPRGDMKGNDQVLELLNLLLTNELTAINQYFIHAKMCENWGFERLAAVIRAESIDEMKHADEVISRILFLEGVPNLQRYNKLRVGETVKEQLESDLELERVAIEFLNNGIKTAREVSDNASEDLFTRILVAEEQHTDWIETQLELIRQVGEQNYLAQQIRK
jgi:bacterioferritin